MSDESDSLDDFARNFKPVLNDPELEKLGQTKGHKDAILYARFSPNAQPEPIDAHVTASVRLAAGASSSSENPNQTGLPLRPSAGADPAGWERLRSRDGIFYYYNWHSGEVKYTSEELRTGKDAVASRAERSNPHIYHVRRRLEEKALEPSMEELRLMKEMEEWHSSDSDYPFEHEKPCLQDARGHKIDRLGRRKDEEAKRQADNYSVSKNLTERRYAQGKAEDWKGVWRNRVYFSHWQNTATGQKLSNRLPRFFGIRSLHD